MTSINVNSSSAMGMTPRPQAQPLSDEQKSLIEETLSGFDPENLSQEDALSITETFKEAGIQPSPEMADLMAEFDFDAKAVGEQSGMQPPPPPSENSDIASMDITDELLQSLNGLINEYYSDSLSDEDKESTLSSIKQILQDSAPEQGLVNTSA